MTKRAMITGITGQDGSYLAELLIARGYEVHGLIRRASTFNTDRIDHIYQDLHQPDAKLLLHFGDLANSEQITNLIYNLTPDEIYNLGAQSHVRVSFDIPEYTSDITGLGATRLLEAIRRSGVKARYYQASSSEMFGATPPPQNEETSFHPRSPYAAAKLYAYWMTRNYRDGYGLYGANGILFNHESPRRGQTFVTHKITRALVNITLGKQDKLYLGNLDAERDWGYAPEYVSAMWLMLQHDAPGDYVVGTGETHSVKDFLSEAFTYLDLDWREYVEIDQRYFRPTEVVALRADPSKIRRELGWEPAVTFKDLVRIMVDADAEAMGVATKGEGRAAVAQKCEDWHCWDDNVKRSAR